MFLKQQKQLNFKLYIYSKVIPPVINSESESWIIIALFIVLNNQLKFKVYRLTFVQVLTDDDKQCVTML